MTVGTENSKRRLHVGRVLVTTSLVALSVLVFKASTTLAQSTFSLSYSARLTSADGAPLTAPQAVKVTFWDSNTVGQQLGPTLSFDAVALNNGALSLDLPLSSTQVNDVFGDGSRAIYIEITAGDKTYPRQKYTFVPLALRVPLDEKTLKFNDSGKLTLAVGTKPNSNSFLTQDSSGALTWGSPAASQLSISDQDVAAGASIAQSKIAGLSASLAAKEPAITAGTNTQYFRGDKTWQALTTASVTEGGTNLYYTDARARSALTGSGPITYGVVSGTIGIDQASATANGYLSSSDWAAFNSKQNALGYSPVNKAGDTMSGALDMNSSDIKNAGQISMATSKTLMLSNNATDPTGLTTADKGKTWFNSGTNEIKYWDGTAAKALGVAGSGLANLNGLTTTTQSFATPGTSGTAPTWSSNGSTHTLNIPLASASGVAAGLVSNADHTLFTNKISAVSAGTGLTGGGSSGAVTLNADVGTTANKLVQLDASAKLPGVDGSALTNLNPINLSAAVPVAKGGTGLTSGTAGGVPYFSSTNAITSTPALTSNGVILGGGSGAPTATAAGAANSVLRVPSAGGAPSFGAIDLAQSSAVGGLLGVANGGTGAASTSANYVFAGPTGSAGAPGFRALVAADYPTMVGANGTTAGTKGAAPAPSAAENTKFLRGDGTWQTPPAAAGGSDGQIQVNSSGLLSGNSGFVYSGGNVGIGTTSPGYLLAVNSGTADGNYDGIGIQGNGTDLRLKSGSYVNWANNTIYSTGNIVGIQPKYNSGSPIVALAPNSGNVGIGTTSPISSLHTTGALTVAGINAGYVGTTQISYPGSPVASRLTFGTDGTGYQFRIGKNQNGTISDFFSITDSGNVGVGTTSPDPGTMGVKAMVSGGSMVVRSPKSSLSRYISATTFNNISTLSLWYDGAYNDTTDSMNASGGSITFGGPYHALGYESMFAGIRGAKESTADQGGNGYLSFHTYSQTNANMMERMRISSAGNVGIGSTSPTAQLDVVGDVKTSGSISYGPFKDFRMVFQDTFESAATGWSTTTRSACGPSTILGGYNVLSTTSVSRTFDLTGIPHSEVMVRATYYFIDTWDSEWGYMKLDGYPVWSRQHLLSQPGNGSFCGQSNNYDLAVTVLGSLPHSGNSLVVLFGSNLDSVATDESYGVDNVEVWVR